jgi:hypothetical protein
MAGRVLGISAALVCTVVSAVWMAGAADQISFNFGIFAASSQESPIQIVGFMTPERKGAGPRLVVRNSSDLDVISFRVGVSFYPLMGAVAPSELDFPGGPNLKHEEGPVPAHGTQITDPTNLMSQTLVVFASATQVVCLNTLVWVKEWTLSNGTVGRASASPGSDEALSNDLQKKGCGDVVSSQADRDLLTDFTKAPSFPVPVNARLSPQRVDEYHVVCHLRRRAATDFKFAGDCSM